MYWKGSSSEPPHCHQSRRTIGSGSKKWDKSRVEQLSKERRLVWGHTFKNIAVHLLTRIKNGEHDTLSRWMAQECRDYLCMPALRC